MKAFDDLLDGLLVEQKADHQLEDVEPRPVEDIIAQLLDSERVVLVGEPGSGKSFTLRRLVMRYIREYETHRRVPVFVPLNTFKGETDFVNYIRVHMNHLAPYYEQMRDAGSLVLICDALNEMPRRATGDGRDLVAEVRDELRKAPHFVVSCRVRDYRHDLDSLKLERLEVRDLDLPAIREFVRRYRLLLDYDDEALWQKMGGSDALSDFWKSVKEKGEPARFWDEMAGVPNYTSGESDSAWRRMWQGAKLIPLARNPYMAGVICTLHGKATMPENRAELYAAFVTELYEHERDHAHRRGQAFPERAPLEDFLTGLATRMQAEQTTVLKSDSIADERLLQASLDATIVIQDGGDLRFAHQLLQEYFAARTLAQKMYANEPLVLENWWAENVWRETFMMLAEFVEDKALALRWLGQANPELAYKTWNRVQHGVDIDPDTQEALITSARAKTTERNPQGRAAAYRVLGLLDADTRPGVGVVFLPSAREAVGEGAGVRALPDIDWVHIPAGEFTMGHEDESDNPPRVLTLDYDYHIARYPVTYAQFQTFLDDPEGYRNTERWFEGLAANDGDKRMWDQRFKNPNHPRETVNWYQAVAFCRWLSWRLETLTPNPSPSGRGAYDPMNPATWLVRLPTEFEWEKAARANTGWQYPYGNDFDAAKGNTGETGIGQTSAVGIFPAGDTPHWSKPISDLSGNVWEWCLTDYNNPQVDATKENISSSALRVLRGGSWDYNRDLARAVSRFNLNPSNRYYNFGFRFLCASPFS